MVHRFKEKKLIGIKQSIKGIKSQIGDVIYVAKNADEKLVKPVIELAQSNNVKIVYVDTMKELGKLCGIEVGAATALILKE